MTGLRGLSVGKGGGSIGSARTQDIVGQIGGLGSGTEGANVAPATQGGGSGAKRMTLETALLEVEARFLLNLPEEELASVDRLFFQMEQAHWYYEDFLADKYDSLPHFPLEGFTRELFQHSELLKHLKERHEDMVRDFHSYKYQVPVYGCVLLNSAKNKFVLVCNWEGTAWGLPRGKVNEVSPNPVHIDNRPYPPTHGLTTLFVHFRARIRWIAPFVRRWRSVDTTRLGA